MKLRLRLDVEGMYFNGGAVVEVPELVRQEFEPLNTCDDKMFCAAVGDSLAGSYEVKVKMKAREDAAKILADALARMIVNEMKKNDTHNGYKSNS